MKLRKKVIPEKFSENETTKYYFKYVILGRYNEEEELFGIICAKPFDKMNIKKIAENWIQVLFFLE